MSITSLMIGILLGGCIGVIAMALIVFSGSQGPDRRSRGRTPPTGYPGAATGGISEPLADGHLYRYSPPGYDAAVATVEKRLNLPTPEETYLMTHRRFNDPANISGPKIMSTGKPLSSCSWKMQVAAAIEVETKTIGTKNIVVRHLKIHKCDDPLMWYAGDVGRLVPYRGVWPESGWHSSQYDGYSNVVRFDDADLVTEVIPAQ